MSQTDKVMELLPCPFCGAGHTEAVENGKMWTGMRYSEPTSVSIRHWCDPIQGQPSRMIERVGKDLEAAVAAWNTRAHIEAMQRDCRTCKNYASVYGYCRVQVAVGAGLCINHDKYQPMLEFKQLTRES